MEEAVTKTLKQTSQNPVFDDLERHEENLVVSAGRPNSGRGPKWHSGIQDLTTNRDEQSKKKHNSGVLVIGDGISLRGETIICKNLIVSGKLEASASCSRLKISETGTVFGNVTVTDAEIRGTFEGSLLVKGCLIIHPGAKVFGRVTYTGLRIFRGGKLLGDVRHAADTGANTGMKNPPATSFQADFTENKPGGEIVRKIRPAFMKEEKPDAEIFSTNG